MHKGSHFPEKLARGVVYLVLAIWTFIILAPLYWMTISSLKSRGDLFDLSFAFWPKKVTIQGYYELFSSTLFLRWTFNTLFIGIVTAIIGGIVCSLAGFAFAKYTFKGKNALFMIVLSSVMIPLVVNVIPLFALMNAIHWLNSYQALILPFCGNAFVVFFIRSYMSGIPNSLLDYARIDGCTEARIFFNIIAPIAKPALASGFIFLFMDQWIQYFWPLIAVSSNRMAPLTIGLAALYADVFNIRYDVLMAGAALSIAPLIILFILLQKYFIVGLTGGMVKG